MVTPAAQRHRASHRSALRSLWAQSDLADSVVAFLPGTNLSKLPVISKAFRAAQPLVLFTAARRLKVLDRAQGAFLDVLREVTAGWQPNVNRILSDIVPMLSAELKHALREFVRRLKAKRDAREIPSVSAALMEQAPHVVGTDLWQQCIDRQRREKTANRFLGKLLRPGERVQINKRFARGRWVSSALRSTTSTMTS